MTNRKPQFGYPEAAMNQLAEDVTREVLGENAARETRRRQEQAKPQAPSKLQSKLDEMERWLASHSQGAPGQRVPISVDRQAFREAVNELILLAFPVGPRPLLTPDVSALSVAAAMAGRRLPAFVVHSDLPGAERYLELMMPRSQS